MYLWISSHVTLSSATTEAGNDGDTSLWMPFPTTCWCGRVSTHRSCPRRWPCGPAWVGPAPRSYPVQMVGRLLAQWSGLPVLESVAELILKSLWQHSSPGSHVLSPLVLCKQMALQHASGLCICVRFSYLNLSTKSFSDFISSFLPWMSLWVIWVVFLFSQRQDYLFFFKFPTKSHNSSEHTKKQTGIQTNKDLHPTNALKVLLQHYHINF